MPVFWTTIGQNVCGNGASPAEVGEAADAAKKSYETEWHVLAKVHVAGPTQSLNANPPAGRRRHRTSAKKSANEPAKPKTTTKKVAPPANKSGKTGATKAKKKRIR